jgi:hypothetical protein
VDSAAIWVTSPPVGIEQRDPTKHRPEPPLRQMPFRQGVVWKITP